MKKSTIIKLLQMTILVLVLSIPAMAFAGSAYIVSPDGTYLGNLNTNKYDPNSVANPYGRYGSKYSSESINNPYGRYGSPYSNDSANNPYGTNSPMIIHRNH